MYASDSETRLLHLRFDLHNIKKGEASVADFLRRVTIARDKLAAAGEKISDSQIILLTLGGFGTDYQSFITSITTRFDKNMTFSTFKSLLIDFDLQFSPSRLEANVAVKNKSDDRRDKSFCQICSKKGHGAKDCYHRVNFRKFLPISHSRRLVASDLENFLVSTNNVTPSANFVTTSRAPAIWYPDTGATSHIAKSGNSVGRFKKYTGNDSVYIANGGKMRIEKVGRMMASKLILEEVLLVPEASRNLL